MVKILVIIPYHELQTAVEAKLRLVNTEGFSVVTTHIYGTDRKTIASIDADIVVARGLTKEAIMRLRPNIHVVGIPLSIVDFLEALSSCKEQYPGSSIGWIGSQDLEGLSPRLSALINTKVVYARVCDQEGVRDAISRLHGDGCEVFVGGLTVCHACEELHYPYVQVRTGRSAMDEAIDDALAMGRSLERTARRGNLLATLINNTRDAMVALDPTGKVMAYNDAALLLFGVEMGAQGISSDYPNQNWEDCFNGNIRTELVQMVKGQMILVTQQPMQGLGVLLTFENIERLQKAEQKIRTKLAAKGLVAKYTFKNILTQNVKMQALVAKAHRYSQVDEAVLLIGETGVGKELFAQSIHNASPRASAPFVAINCAALPENLLESELFGYEEGAFSGARKGGKVGLFELAHKGTLFLDEIGEMSVGLQAKLLRVLQEKEIRRVGGDANIPVDVRIISATNVNIRDKVKQGLFRLDLFYRISLLSIQLPPLREHIDDIPVLFEAFVRRYCEKHDFRMPLILPEAYELLKTYAWLGNTRELRNVAERLGVLRSGPVVGVAQIRELDIESTSMVPYDGPDVDGSGHNSLLREFLLSGLTHEAFAKEKGISRSTLWRRLRDGL